MNEYRRFLQELVHKYFIQELKEGPLTREYFVDDNGCLHNSDGPADVLRCDNTIHKFYYNHGVYEKYIRLSAYYICG